MYLPNSIGLFDTLLIPLFVSFQLLLLSLYPLSLGLFLLLLSDPLLLSQFLFDLDAFFFFESPPFLFLLGDFPEPLIFFGLSSLPLRLFPCKSLCSQSFLLLLDSFLLSKLFFRVIFMFLVMMVFIYVYFMMMMINYLIDMWV